MTRLAAIWRLFLYLGWLALHIPAIWALGRFAKADARLRFVRRFHRIGVRLLGITLRRVGAASRHRPTLTVANHSSYLDIMCLGAVAEGNFVSKAELRGWPFFGAIAKLHKTIFIDRQPRNAGEHRDLIRDRLAAGENVIVFAEGTSGDGIGVLPFKSTLFNCVEPERGGIGSTWIQPAAIVATALNGLPLRRAERPLFAWFGDMGLWPHVWAFFQAGRFEVTVILFPPVQASAFANRKTLTRHCHDVVARGVAAALAGRIETLEAPPGTP